MRQRPRDGKLCAHCGGPLVRPRDIWVHEQGQGFIWWACERCHTEFSSPSPAVCPSCMEATDLTEMHQAKPVEKVNA
jgi:rRNA maturation endonuclease Nob1